MHRTAIPRPWLLADIGGTNARFGWLAEGATAPGHLRTLSCADHAGPAAAAQVYLRDLAPQLGAAWAPPVAAAFAVATAVAGDEVALTNSGWTFSRRATQASLGLARLVVLNDFEALALSLPHLDAGQWQAIGPAPMRPGRSAQDEPAAMAVIGPGTGLGVAGLVPAGAGWVAVPGEGGHASLSAADEVESALLAEVRRHHPHVSAERLLSGIGLPVLHAAVGAGLGRSFDPGLDTATIVQRGLDGTDPQCALTLDHFCALLGSFAGNVALTLGARGGVFIGGGIVPRLGPHFARSRFRQRFEAKGRFEPYLQAVPTAVITDTLAALTGAASALGAAA